MPLFAGFGTLVLIKDFVFLIIFLCASLDQCNIPGLREQKKVLLLVNLICKIWQFLRQNVANLSIFCDKIWQNLGFQMAISLNASVTGLKPAQFSVPQSIRTVGSKNISQ